MIESELQIYENKVDYIEGDKDILYYIVYYSQFAYTHSPNKILSVEYYETEYSKREQAAEHAYYKNVTNRCFFLFFHGRYYKFLAL